MLDHAGHVSIRQYLTRYELTNPLTPAAWRRSMWLARLPFWRTLLRFNAALAGSPAKTQEGPGHSFTAVNYGAVVLLSILECNQQQQLLKAF